MKKLQIVIAFITLAVFTTPAFSMSKKEFFYEFAKCSYPYFAAGLKWNLNGEERNTVICTFGSKLINIVDIDMSINQQSLNNICKNYQNTNAPEQMSKTEFERAMREYGQGSTLNALKQSR